MFEKFVETLNNTGKAVSEKTKQGTDIVKANLKITTEERELNDLFLEIGKMYYENNRENPCCDHMKELFDKVAEKEAAVEELKSKVRALKGVVICQNCGAEVGDDNAFCGKCGAKIERPEPVEAVEEAKEISDTVVDHEDNVEVVDENGEPSIKIELAKDENNDE
ncbi:MAG: zinc ribbon domain-containing protein [Oscillospiraceae bacterium]|nr:zinc ribbon domain-containing protein [Oscillospiraceae bacterium]